MNSQEVAYQFGQLGSAHTQTAANTVIPPDGMVIVAVQFLDAVALSELEVENKNIPLEYSGTETLRSFAGITSGNNSGGSEVIDTSVTFPKGTVIYGRWTKVSLNANNDHGVICYFGN
mgnify:CR=1 FL=1